MLALAPPVISLADPLLESEGSVDPLSLARTCEQLADRFLLAVTLRMSRIPFLTAVPMTSPSISAPRYTRSDGPPTQLAGGTPWRGIDAITQDLTLVEAYREAGRAPLIRKVSHNLTVHEITSVEDLERVLDDLRTRVTAELAAAHPLRLV